MPQGAIPFPFGDCKICCDKATGVHYGVATCEGCKGFFKRSIPKAEKYKCFFGGQCQLSPQNRNRCKACRFQRCIEMGMSMDAVKMGRIPKVDKERALEAHKGNPIGHPDSGLPHTDDHSPGFDDGMFLKQEDPASLRSRPYDLKSPSPPTQQPQHQQEHNLSFTEQLSDRALMEASQHHLHSQHPATSHPMHTTTAPLPPHHSHNGSNPHHYSLTNNATSSQHAYNGQDGHPLSNQDSGYSDGNNSDGGSPKDSAFPPHPPQHNNNNHPHPSQPSPLVAADYKFLQTLEQAAATVAHDYSHSQDQTSSSNSSSSSLRFPPGSHNNHHHPHHNNNHMLGPGGSGGDGEASFLSSLRDLHNTSMEGAADFSSSNGSSSNTSSGELPSPSVLKDLLSQAMQSGVETTSQEQILKHLCSVLPDHKALTQNLIAVLQSPQVLAELVPQLVASLTKNCSSPPSSGGGGGEGGQSPLKRRYSDPGPKEEDLCEGLPHPPKVQALDPSTLSRTSSPRSLSGHMMKSESGALSELCQLVLGQQPQQQGEGFKEPNYPPRHLQKPDNNIHHYNRHHYERSVSVDHIPSTSQYDLGKVKQERMSPSFTTGNCGVSHHQDNKTDALWDDVFKGNKAIFGDRQEDELYGGKNMIDLSMKARNAHRESPHSSGEKLPEGEFPPQGGSADNEAMIISTLSKLSEAETSYCQKLRDDTENMLETIAGKRRMHEVNYLSQATYRQVKLVWKALFDDITNVNKMIISLCQAIPGFVKLDLEEQAKLMEDAYFDLWLILFSVLFTSNESYIRMNDNIHYTRFWMSHFLPESLINKMFQFTEQLNSLKLSRLEICVLCAIQLTHPDRSSKEEVRLLHSHFLDVLVYTIEKSHPVNHSRILVNLFRILPLLQAIQVEQAQVIGTFRAEKPPVQCEAMVVVGSVEEELARLEAERLQEEQEEEAQKIHSAANTDSFSDDQSRDNTSIDERLWSDSLN